jgi:hypothetical protein
MSHSAGASSGAREAVPERTAAARADISPELLARRVDKNGFPQVPLLSHIEDQLYVGMSPCYWGGGHEVFSSIFDFYSGCLLDDDEDRYQAAPHTTHHHLRIHDGHELPSKALVDEIAAKIVQAARSGPTLVHCQMGINRSNLFAAVALHQMGRSMDDAILFLRSQRYPFVLMNWHFERFLREQYP